MIKSFSFSSLFLGLLLVLSSSDLHAQSQWTMSYGKNIAAIDYGYSFGMEKRHSLEVGYMINDPEEFQWFTFGDFTTVQQLEALYHYSISKSETVDIRIGLGFRTSNNPAGDGNETGFISLPLTFNYYFTSTSAVNPRFGLRARITNLIGGDDGYFFVPTLGFSYRFL